MNVLVIAPLFPWPLESGGHVRLYQMLRHLAADHCLTCVTLTLDQPGATPLDEFARMEPVVVDRAFWSLAPVRLNLLRTGVPPRAAASYRPALGRRLDELKIEEFDLVHFAYIESTPYLRDIEARLRGRTVLDTVHIAAVTARRQFETAPGPLAKAAPYINWRWLKRYERRLFERFDAVLVCSEVDAAIVRSESPKAKVEIIPNGVDETLVGLDRHPAPRPNLLFLGGTNHDPNVDGLKFFLDRCWPALKAANDNLVINVVGEGWPDQRWLDNRPGITRLGFVPDLTALFQQSTAFIAPIRHGSGTRLKILEALACGLPVVCTSVAAEGLAVKNGVDALIADDAPDFTAAVKSVVNEPALAARLGEAGRALVKTRYQWKEIMAALDKTYRSLNGQQNADKAAAR